VALHPSVQSALDLLPCAGLRDLSESLSDDAENRAKQRRVLADSIWVDLALNRFAQLALVARRALGVDRLAPRGFFPLFAELDLLLIHHGIDECRASVEVGRVLVLGGCAFLLCCAMVGVTGGAHVDLGYAQHSAGPRLRRRHLR